MELWTALTLGFVGSFHCVGMCGPIALALPGNGQVAPWRFAISRLSYNLGRITTYAALGLLFGLLGRGFALAGLQQGLSIVLGLAILVTVLMPSAFRSLSPTGPLGKLVRWLKGSLQEQFRKRGTFTTYLIGLLNGLLPCGLVYLAVAGALTQEVPWKGAVYMVAFGAGTLPAMLLLVFTGDRLSLYWSNGIRKVVPWFAAFTGILLVVRGLSLGIPFLSPVLQLVERGITVCGFN